MRFKSLSLIIFIVILLLLAGCGGECKVDADCQKSHFTGKCVNKKCVFTPIPNEIGNGICEQGENKCNAPADCGICRGSNGLYLKYQCINNKCVDAVPLEKIKPVYLSSDSRVSGIEIKTTSDFNQPFNFKKDLFNLKFSLMSLPNTIEDVMIKRIELTGITADRRKVTLFDAPVNRPLRLELDVEEDLILDLNTAENSGELNNLKLNMYIDYYVVSSGKRSLKSSSFPVRFSGLNKFVWVMPESEYSCPESCDDDNPGTEDFCSEATDFFCVHKPIAGQCGNFICEPGENKCTCEVDCGACAGPAGNYMSYSCVDDVCKARLRASFSQEKKSIFDDRDLSYFHLQNNFEFNYPFNLDDDSVVLKFSLYDKNADVSQIRITDVRLFEGTSEIAHTFANIGLSNVGDAASVSVKIPEISGVEESMTLNLAVWYEFNRGDQTVKNDFRKSLGKITVINPGS
ncbi:hypothetical protein GF358_01695 [Candidatus Woesearchaeota archaeon]|nr:hypothetical protein [Candidatus Woesearchaeota archaeon]